MHAKTLSTLMIALLFLVTAPSGLGSGLEDDREAFYVGGSVTAPPPDVLLPDCDTQPGPHAGGVLFCDVPAGSTILITIADNAIATPTATVTCYIGGSPVSHQSIGSATPSLTTTPPPSCATHPHDKADTVRIGVFPQLGAIEGTVTLYFL